MDCDLICLSATASGTREAVGIVQSTKIPVAIGGQCTLWSGLKDYPFTWIIKGEGEAYMRRLVLGSLPPGFYESANDSDLDSLVFPERGFLYGGKAPILTSRGCPFHCYFCSSSEYWDNTRFCSPEYFMSEVDYILRRYKEARWLYIVDDLFVANRPRFEKIYDLWMVKGYNKRLGFHGFIRAGVFDLDMARKMKVMGFWSVRFGAESGSDRLLKLLHKGTTVELNQRTIDIANEVGLPITCAFMHHMPTETDEERQATLDFIEKNKGKMKVDGFFHFTPFPGTKFYAGENPITTEMRDRDRDKELP